MLLEGQRWGSHGFSEAFIILFARVWSTVTMVARICEHSVLPLL